MGRITYLYVSRLEECKADLSKGNAYSGPQEDLYNIKADTVVRLFLFKLIQINLFFSISCQLIVYFMDSLITIMDMIYEYMLCRCYLMFSCL